MALGLNRAFATAARTPAIIELATVAEPYVAVSSSLNSDLPATGLQHPDASAPLQATATALDGIPSVEHYTAGTLEPRAFTAAATELFDDPDDDLKPARGFINGVMVAVPMWAVIGLLIWFFLVR
jgi:hypothetical protein